MATTSNDELPTAATKAVKQSPGLSRGNGDVSSKSLAPKNSPLGRLLPNKLLNLPQAAPSTEHANPADPSWHSSIIWCFPCLTTSTQGRLAAHPRCREHHQL
uniref:Uncharacterized protein n=1 Tax=Eutreptiella gymnastica TaxID=73025 RepID=A0A7S4D0W1_9EUGL